jgi:hypothetical protein
MGVAIQLFPIVLMKANEDLGLILLEFTITDKADAFTCGSDPIPMLPCLWRYHFVAPFIPFARHHSMRIFATIVDGRSIG